MSDRPSVTSGTNDTAVMPGFQLSQLDQYIKELNHQGLSLKQISKSLKSLYNIDLGKSAVHRHIVELRQSHENNIRANFKCTSRRAKNDLKWYNIIFKIENRN
jgi:intein-encoded DNA endonuclease-like protein